MLRTLVVVVLLLALMLIPARSGGADTLTWTWTGGPAGAVVVSLLTTPSGTLLAGADDGGLYRSIDGGATWTEPDLSAIWPCCNYSVWSLAASSTTIYLGSNGGGVFRSLDDGETWELTGAIPDEGYPVVMALAACRFGDRVYAGGNFGVCVSEDAGDTWTAIKTGLPSGVWVKSLALRGAILFASMDDGTFRLDPESLTWEAWNDGLSTTAGQQKLCPTSGALFLATHAGGPHHLDCGDSIWVALADGIETNVDDVIETDEALYAGIMGGGVFRCDLLTRYWSPVRDGLWNGDVRHMTHRGLVPYAATYGAGVFELDLDSETWSQRADGMNAPFVTSIVTDATHVYVGTFGGGIYTSDDAGDTWTHSIDGLDDVFIHCMAADASGIYAGTWIGVYKSTDHGATWSRVGLDYIGVFDLRVEGSVLYAGTWGGTVQSSTNGGVNWTQVGTGLPDAMVIGVVRMGGATYAAVNGAGDYRLVDGESTWSAINDGLPQLNAMSLEVSNGYLFVGIDTNGTFRWNPGTESWDATGMTAGTPFCLVDIGGLLYAGTWDGVQVSTDWGATWNTESSGLKSWLAVRAIAEDATRLYAGLNAGGVYRTEAPTGVLSPEPELMPGYSLRVEPNPFAPSARVAFSLDREQPVTVAVFDPAGRLVKTLASGVLPAGPHERTWDGLDERGARAAAGVYMIRLSAGDREVVTRAVRVR